MFDEQSDWMNNKTTIQTSWNIWFHQFPHISSIQSTWKKIHPIHKLHPPNQGPPCSQRAFHRFPPRHPWPMQHAAPRGGRTCAKKAKATDSGTSQGAKFPDGARWGKNMTISWWMIISWWLINKPQKFESTHGTCVNDFQTKPCWLGLIINLIWGRWARSYAEGEIPTYRACK